MRTALLALLLPVSLALAADIAPLPVAVPATSAQIRYSGRWDTQDTKGPRAEWPAVALRFTLDGSAANVVLAGPKDHAFQVVVDGKPGAVITLVPGQGVYPVASGLPPGRHQIELWKRTECWGGPVQVQGLQLAEGAKLLDPPAAPTRRIEFLGDSITAGYGNEAASKEEHFSFKTENAWLAWAAVAARALDAEPHIEAISGCWLQDNGQKKNVMPALWRRTMPFTASKAWDTAAWQPDAVVINLGTNDTSAKKIDEKPWHDAYVAFIADLRKAYPQAHIFLTIGSMGHGPDGVIPRYNAAIVAELAAAGDTRVHALALANQKPSNGIGADWHPSVKTHQIMADTLAAAVRKELGW